jgi:hypothetical protein
MVVRTDAKSTPCHVASSCRTAVMLTRPADWKMNSGKNDIAIAAAARMTIEKKLPMRANPALREASSFSVSLKALFVNMVRAR